jgi:nitrous oxidase accessory protein NosD
MQSKVRLIVIIGVILALGMVPLLAVGQTGQHAFGTPEFQQVWERTDLPVEQGLESRTWMWGPAANTPVLQEPYEEGSGGMRDVQYSDKSRMEMPVHPVEPGSDWFITQGLLATELMTGEMQLGDATFVQHEPSAAFVAGDPANNESPTYAQMGQLMDEPARSVGDVITEVIAADGSISSDPSLAGHGVTAALYVEETEHTIASVFWDFMNSTGTVYANGQFGHGPVFNNPFYAIGFPTTEAYWGHVTVAEAPQMVLMQCFQRRCLTFTPENDPGWQVESGNIGQHYYDWRYNRPHYPDDGVGDDTPPATDDSSDDAEDSLVPSSLHVSPTGTNADIGEAHTITVSVEDQHSSALAGADVHAQVTGVSSPHQGTWLQPDPAQTGGNGVAQLSYTGTEPGTDTITVTVDGLTGSETVTHNWHDPDACTEVTAGQSIQAAIDAALPGDEICVDFGVYEEVLSITTDGLTLTGSFGAALDGSNVSALDSIGIYIEADDVTVQGLEIRNYLDYNVVVGESSRVELTDLNLLPGANTAISVYHSDTVEISNTDISLGPDTGSERTGIMADAVTGITISNVDIEDADMGVALRSDPFDDDTPQTSGSIQNSDIHAHGGIGIRTGGTEEITIQNNEIRARHIGIQVGGFSGAVIDSNNLPQGDIGIEVGSLSGAEITDNTLSNHGIGIFQSNLNSAEIQGNTISDFDDIGILVDEGPTTTTVDQNVIEQGSIGVLFRETTEATVTDNVIRMNDNGIQVEDAAQGGDPGIVQTFTGNELTENGTGILVGAGADPSFMSVNFNDIVSNNRGIRNSATATLDATMNFWGHHSGPSGDGSGSGDSISGNINYLPVHATPINE